MAQVLITQETQKRLIEERTELRKQNFLLLNNIKVLQVEYDSIASESYRLARRVIDIERKFEITAEENKRLFKENKELKEGMTKYIRFAKMKDQQYDELKRKDYSKMKKYSYDGWLNRKAQNNTILATGIMSAGAYAFLAEDFTAVVIVSSGVLLYLVIKAFRK